MTPPMTVVHRVNEAALTPGGQRAGADSGDPQVALAAIAPEAAGNIGIWECRPGGWPVIDRDDTEVAFILEGRATLTDSSTRSTVHVAPGDLLVLPIGWTGRWDVTETVRKIYVIY